MYGISVRPALGPLGGEKIWTPALWPGGIQGLFLFNCLQIKPMETWTVLVQLNVCSELSNIQIGHLTCLFFLHETPPFSSPFLSLGPEKLGNHTSECRGIWQFGRRKGCECLQIAVMSTDFCPWSLQGRVSPFCLCSKHQKPFKCSSIPG